MLLHLRAMVDRCVLAASRLMRIRTRTTAKRLAAGCASGLASRARCTATDAYARLAAPTNGWDRPIAHHAMMNRLRSSVTGGGVGGLGGVDGSESAFEARPSRL